MGIDTFQMKFSMPILLFTMHSYGGFLIHRQKVNVISLGLDTCINTVRGTSLVSYRCQYRFKSIIVFFFSCNPFMHSEGMQHKIPLFGFSATL
jgi:hypothetical protein